MKRWISLMVLISTGLLIWGNACGRRFQSKLQKISLPSLNNEEELYPNTFSMTRDGVRLLPYTSVESKIKSLNPELPDNLFSQIRGLRFDMGDFDFSKGIAPELSWTQNKMDAWMTALLPICESTQYLQKYPFPSESLYFITTSYGRDSTDKDLKLISDIKNLNTNSITATDRSKILCLLVFSSIEFLGN